ncbi:MAG: Crp/Fnr family transcriptional regulator, partial [Chloroflexi bacterium]
MDEIMEESRLDHLRKVPLFLNLPDEALQVAAAEAHPQSYEKGSFLFYQDDPAVRIYVVTDGRVKLAQLSEDGSQVIMRVATAWMMIAVISLVPGAVYPVSAEAAGDCRVIYWTQAELQALLERYPSMALNA